MPRMPVVQEFKKEKKKDVFFTYRKVCGLKNVMLHMRTLS